MKSKAFGILALLVVLAMTLTQCGATPVPVQAPPDVALEEVTNG